MKNLLTPLTMALAALAFGCQNLHHEYDNDEHDGDEEHEIALSQVPQVVKAAALAAVPGLVIEEACTETENGALIYCLEGEANGTDYELEVTADGRVLEVESADDEDDEEDDD